MICLNPGDRDVARGELIGPDPLVVVVVRAEYHKHSAVIRRGAVESADAPTDLLHGTCRLDGLIGQKSGT